MSHPPLDATWENLGPEPREALLEWRRRVVEDEPYKGLWIVAPRAGGSSYVAKVAMRRMVYGETNMRNWEWLTGLELIKAMRTRWSSEDMMRHHPDDYALWQESDLIQRDFDYFWDEAQIVCVDDLHSSLDIGFWRKHLQHDLEARVKLGKPTIVATDMAPNHSGFSDIQRVIETWFVICDARR